MLVFIDESGDGGFRFDKGSSPVFVLTAVTFSDVVEAERCRDCIRQVRAQRGFSPSKEFHFAKDSQEVRLDFLSAVGGCDFVVDSVVIDKRLLQAREYKSKQAVYQKAVTLLMSQLLGCLTDADVRSDKCGDRTFISRLKVESRSVFDGDDWPIRSWKPIKSHTEDLIQLADMACGSIAREFSTKRDRVSYRDQIRKRERAAIVWPQADA